MMCVTFLNNLNYDKDSAYFHGKIVLCNLYINEKGSALWAN